MNKQRNLVIGLIIVLVIMLLLGALVSLLIGKGEKVSPDVKKALAKQKKELDNKYQSEIESKDKQIAELKKVNNSEATK